MTVDDLQFLQSADGYKLLDHYKNYSDDELFRLLLKSGKKAETPFLASVVSLIRLRRKVVEKFSLAAEMFFDSAALEQSTGENISRHIAERFLPDWQVAELGCGAGGNTIALAKQCKKVYAVDNNEFNLACAEANSRVYSCNKKIEFILGEANKNIITDVQAFFLDPARGREGKTKTRSFLNSSPNLLEILPSLLKITDNIAVKISPAFDYRELEQLPSKPEVEIISEENNCKMAMLWFGGLKKYDRSATCFFQNQKYFYHSQSLLKITVSGQTKQYLYEVNKAISRAGLANELAVEYGLAVFGLAGIFLTGDKLVGLERPGLMKAFRVLAVEEFSGKKLQAFVKERNIERADIIAKDFRLKPEELYKIAKIKEGGGLFLIFTSFSQEKLGFILAERV